MPTRTALPLHGVWLPLITPFREGAVDHASLRRLTAHYAAQPIQGFVLAATTGEGLTLDEDEARAVCETVAAETRLPLILGLCGADTRRLVAALKRTHDLPVRGALIACPYYSRPSQEGLRLHFEALSDAAPGDVVIYNIPYRTGVNLRNETMLRLAERANIVGVKDCCADPAQSAALIRDRPPGFAVLTGEDKVLGEALDAGADGAILASAHVATAAFAALCQADAAGRAAQWPQLRALPDLLFAEPNPAAIKHWLWRAGLIASPELRLPMTPVSPTLAARLDAAIEAGAWLDQP